jgi:pilus assembly protein CpaE
MDRLPDVLLASRTRPGLDELAGALGSPEGFDVRTRLLDGDRLEELWETRPTPDVVVVRFDRECAPLLAALTTPATSRRPPLLVVGPAGDPEVVRLAVRCGARDFLPSPASAEDLSNAIARILQETPPQAGTNPSELTVVVGAAGGVGTSFIACNLAHALAAGSVEHTLLVDLDVNDAPLAGFLDLTPQRGLLQALGEVRYMDEHALSGYVTRHHSGLHLLAAPSERLVPASSVDPASFEALMGLLARRYSHIVVDGLHGLQPPTPTAIGLADNLLVVLQQSVVQLRQCVRLLRVLAVDFGFPPARTSVVLNRYRKNTTVSVEDVRRALGHERIVTVPNHFPTVHASIDGGVPLGELERSSAVARAISDLQRLVTGAPPPEPRSLLRRAFPILSGG